MMIKYKFLQIWKNSAPETEAAPGITTQVHCKPKGGAHLTQDSLANQDPEDIPPVRGRGGFFLSP